jgi:hypothetical protein
MTILTSIVLVYLVSTTPIVHVRFVDKLSDLPVCLEIIAKVAEGEKNEPLEEQISPRLRCMAASYDYNPDGDGPSKPVNGPVERVEPSCKNPVTRAEVKCKDAGYNPLPTRTE